MHLYITSSTAKLGVSQNNLTIEDDGEVKPIPFSQIDGVSVFGMPALSTKLLREFIRRKINLQFFSQDGHYFGRLSNYENISNRKQKLQVFASEDQEFCLSISKSLIRAKLTSQLSLLKTYSDTFARELPFETVQIFEQSILSVDSAPSVPSLLGIEGTVARTYFQAISELLPFEFKFKGRTRRPPKDPFNSMLGFCYSLLYHNIVGAVERHGLNPYFGFMHQDSENHATLVSDLMEEWRAPICDDTVLQLIFEGEVDLEMFETNEETGGVFIHKDAMKKIVKAMTNKLSISEKYLDYDENRYGFQHALDMQIYRLVNAIETKDPSVYLPVTIEAGENGED